MKKKIPACLHLACSVGAAVLCLCAGISATSYAWDVQWFEAPKADAEKVSATEASAPAVEPLPSIVETGGNGTSQKAIVRVLDKQTNRVQALTLVGGEPVAVGSLRINLQRCVFDYRQTPALDTAWLDILDEQEKDKSFSGWMFNLFPSAVSLESARYDVTFDQCILGDGQVRYMPKNTRKARIKQLEEYGRLSKASGTATHEETGTTEKDPFYVPGVGDEEPAVAEPVVEGIVDSSSMPVELTPAEQDQKELRRMMEDAGQDVFGAY